MYHPVSNRRTYHFSMQCSKDRNISDMSRDMVQNEQLKETTSKYIYSVSKYCTRRGKRRSISKNANRR